MSIGQALREARERRGLTQEATGQAGYISGKMVSAIECGRRAVGPDVLERLATKLDYPRLYMEAAAEVTGGVYAAEYEPDMARMVKALRVLLDYNPEKGQKREMTMEQAQKEEVMYS